MGVNSLTSNWCLYKNVCVGVSNYTSTLYVFFMVLCLIKQRSTIFYFLIILTKTKSDFSDISFLESYAKTSGKFDFDSA
jgi:hypothetical protein